MSMLDCHWVEVANRATYNVKRLIKTTYIRRADVVFLTLNIKTKLQSLRECRLSNSNSFKSFHLASILFIGLEFVENTGFLFRKDLNVK